MSPEHIFDILAPNTPQINLYSMLKLPLLGYEPKRADLEYVALMQMSCCSREEGAASSAQVKALAVLSFTNKHSTISTSLLCRMHAL